MTKSVTALTRLGLSREEALTRLRDNNWDLQQAVTSLTQEDGSEGFDDGEEEVGCSVTQMFDDDHDHDGLRVEVDNPLYTFLNDPAYKQMRDDIRANPDKANEYLDTLKQTAPQLHELLLTNDLSLDEIAAN